MKGSNSAISNVNDILCYEVLIRIFMTLSITDLAVVSLVCKYWNQACRDPVLWKKLDLTQLSSHSFRVPKLLDAWYDRNSSTKMSQFLKYVLNLSDGNISCLIYNYYVYMRDEHLISAAERTPNLKRLVLPRSGQLSKTGIDIAMKFWGGLESLTITSMVKHADIFSAIGKYCKRITELKFTCAFEDFHANYLIKCTPNLKFLSIRSVMVNKKGLCRVLQSLEHLEVVNICHSLIVERPNPRSRVVVYRIHDLRNHLDITCLRKLLFCKGRCLRCKYIGRENNPTRLSPYGTFEGIWRDDEIPSLAH
ncbi:F-box/LRR-repeat protein At3g48880-like [Gastrolobium bilobum]|uniref:F-box/LRR-repeat protein At3g48880-like n=1 Tax=Gastrolobium bilobum TaxID=150636 RepID=UPI002AB11822|nr:F-box/LRR-repeat protein At3g48880-like [Gastrolobium bilobum]